MASWMDRAARRALLGIAGAALLTLASRSSASDDQQHRTTAPPGPAGFELPTAEEAPTCRVDERPRPETTAATAAALAELRARLAHEAGEAQDVVVLNGRGYNYEQPLPADPATLRFEAGQPKR
jgi:hypothetical protein